MINTKRITYVDKDYPAKLLILSKLSKHPEIQDVLDTITDEISSYLSKENIKNEFIRMDVDIKEETFDTFLNIVDIDWHNIKEFLITGYLARELIYNGDQFISTSQLDPVSLTPVLGKQNIPMWSQFRGTASEITLFDTQVNYISYDNDSNRTSYVESLLRPFNSYKLVEHMSVINGDLSEEVNYLYDNFKKATRLPERYFKVFNDNDSTDIFISRENVRFQTFITRLSKIFIHSYIDIYKKTNYDNL